MAEDKGGGSKGEFSSRRSGRDRRFSGDRRRVTMDFVGPDRRSGDDRRCISDRRKLPDRRNPASRRQTPDKRT